MSDLLPTPDIPVEALNKALLAFEADHSEPDCQGCGLPHPSTNPYCFCRRASPGGEGGGMMFYTRWQVARFLVSLALWVAPRGPARSMLLVYLNDFGAEVMDKISNPKTGR